MLAYVVEIPGLSDLTADMAELPKHVQTKARMAVNKVASWARAESSRRIRAQVNLTARYLSDAEGRLKLARLARGASLEAVIVARERPTSLARYMTSYSKRRGATVRVKPGAARRMSRAFPMRLRSGQSGELGNLGLAIRLREGETIKNKRDFKPIGRGLYLLYGASVAQVFRSVADEVRPEAATKLEAEFERLMELDLPNG